MTERNTCSSSCPSMLSTTSTLRPNWQHKRWWRLVWCHLRCHKQGHVEVHRRQAFEEATAAVGAALMCLRKAKQFEDWSSRPGTMPYVLLTDWREVKQCMATLQGRSPQTRPVFTVVIAESSKQYMRATEWAQQLPKDTTDPVYVCQDEADAHTLVSGISAHLNHLLKKHVMHTWLSLSVDGDAWPSLQACPASDQGPGKTRETWETWRAGDFSQPAVPLAPGCWGTVTHDFPARATPEASVQQGERDSEQFCAVPSTLPQEVDRVMQAVWEKCPSGVHAERLLLDAMPETYED